MSLVGEHNFRISCKRAASWAGLALVAVLALCSLAGCSNDPHPRPLQTKRADGSPWVVIYGAIPEDPRSLDPQYSYDTLGHAIISQVYDSLLHYDLFKTSPYELTPCLAESMPVRVRNPDGTEIYEIHLKRGIRFQDDPCFPNGKGRELTSADFVYAFQRIADPKVECPVLSSLQEFIAGLETAYTAARKTGKFDYSKPTGAITIVDDYTFRLNLLKAYPQIQYWLAMPFTAPVAHEAVDYYTGKNGRAQFKFHPVGTGPFRIAEWARDHLIRFERNPVYTATRFPTGGWKAEDEARFRPIAGASLPLVDEVQLSVIRESVPAWLLFRQGYLDRSAVNKDVFNSVITTGLTLSRKYEARGVRLYKDVEPTTAYLAFNMEDPLLGKNRKLRQAISTAYDETRENEIFANGIELKAEQLLPPGVPGYDPDFKNPYRTENLAQAKALLAEAGYPGGIDPKTGKALELTVDIIAESAGARQHAEFQKLQIEQLGIHCRLEENNWARFQDKQDHGQFQMNGGSGWNADYPDPENFFFLFYSKNIPPQGSNHSRYSNPEFDRLFEKMATMDNGPERMKLIRRLNEILVEDCPIVLQSHTVTFSLSQPWIPRVASNAMVPYGWRYAQLDPVLRAAKRKEWNKRPLWPVLTLGGLMLAGIGGALAWARRRNV